ncbi:MAG: SAM-dependent methyltransferase [Chromatiales bacterium]|nr:MAG: SAM-dependent methyltransferase [Chromatiales bacterium]
MDSDWPAPPPSAVALSDELTAQLAARIDAAGGWLDFAEYMQLALYAPGLGYYSAGARNFGAAGDFVTAPEITPAFGACIARGIAPLLQPGDAILELGAGSGALAAAVLDELADCDAPAVDYQVLEVSAELRERQQLRLDAYPVRWLDTLPPSGFRGVILANEVADALPVRRFRWQPDRVQAVGVIRDGAAFAWAARDADAQLAREVEQRREAGGDEWPAGYTSEFCPNLRPWIGGLAACLERGLLLICDYGLTAREYYHPQRRDGTLLCHYRHRAHADPFRWPGLQDITAWVDFTAAAQAGVEAGLKLAGYTTQAQFLMANGVLDAALPDDPVERARHAANLRRLLLPGEMGERFKVLALSRALPDAPLNVGRDLRHRL